MSDEEKLRDEILARQASQRSIAQWKLAGLGALGVIGLGVQNSSGHSMFIEGVQEA